MKKTVFALALLSLLSFSVYAYSQSIAKDLENSLIRLHILADSNSEYDQSIKLAVRDKVLEAVRDISITDTEKFRSAAEYAANKYLEENDIDYSSKAVYGKFDFPEKTYKNITLPAGEYYGIRLILGSGNGENWWCVMYPPICVNENKNAYEQLKSDLKPDTYELITSDKTNVKFKIIEWFNNL